MPKALKSLFLTQVGRIPFSHFQSFSLWGNKNWLPSMKEKKLKNFWDKSSLTGCKWSSLNAPGTESPLSYLGWENSIFSFSAFLSLDNKNWIPTMKVEKLENFQNKIGLTGCKWSSLNAPGTETPQSYPYWEREILPTPIISPLG